MFGAEEEPDPDEQKDTEPVSDDDGNAEPKAKKEVKEKFLKHTLVDEVVEESRIHYYKVPKLGSYLAIKMEYNSCITEEAFDAAILDYKETNAKKVA